jgi:hypothetical protein
MKTTLMGKPNKLQAEARTNPLFNAGIYSQIVSFSDNKIWSLHITNSKEQHEELINQAKACSIVTSYEVFYLFSHASMEAKKNARLGRTKRIYK